MTSRQVKLIYRIASILNQPKKEYLHKIEEFNVCTENDDDDTPYRPLALVDCESTIVHSHIHLKSLDILFAMEKFEKSPLHDAIISTSANNPYNGVTVFTIGTWFMVGILMTGDWLSPDNSVYYSGIYLRSEVRTFGFIKLEEYLKK